MTNESVLFTGLNALSRVGGIRRVSRKHHAKVVAKARRVSSSVLLEVSRSLEIGTYRLQAATSREQWLK